MVHCAVGASIFLLRRQPCVCAKLFYQMRRKTPSFKVLQGQRLELFFKASLLKRQ
jgi:hypothetical protein